jgi:hypothetical protein
VSKLLQNQLDAGADIPVLVTPAFPSGLQPHPQVYKGVLICLPGAVVDFMGILTMTSVPQDQFRLFSPLARYRHRAGAINLHQGD